MYLWQRVFRYNHIILLPCTCICLKCQREVLGKQMQPYTLVCPHTHTHTHTHSHRFIPARAKTSGLPDGWIVLGAPMCCFDCPRPPVPRNSLKNTISQQHLLGPGPYIAVSGDHTDTSNVCVCVCVCGWRRGEMDREKGRAWACVCVRGCASAEADERGSTWSQAAYSFSSINIFEFLTFLTMCWRRFSFMVVLSAVS